VTQGCALQPLCPQPTECEPDYLAAKVLLRGPMSDRERFWPVGHIPDCYVLALNPGREGRSPAFPLVIGLVEPPAGIEPAAPSLPSMRG
jgi:hypothetical protein